MRIERRLVGFGLFLVTVGVVILAVRQGVVPDEAIRGAWSLWPLILIGVGLSIVLAGRPGSALGGLIAVVTVGIILGVAVGSGTFAPGVCSGDRQGGTSFAESGATLSSPAQVSVEQDCGDLHVTTVEGTNWNLGGTSSDGQAPAISASPADVRIHSNDRAPFDLAGSAAWDLVVPREPTISLDVEVNAGDARLDLAGANIASLSVQRNAGSVGIDLRDVAAILKLSVDVNAGSATVWLPDRSLEGGITVNAGSIALCRPPGAGLRIDLGDSIAASNDFEAHGLVRSGNRFETPGYSTATIQIAVTAGANAASFSLDPAGSCAG
jgi:hypothetical protein